MNDEQHKADCLTRWQALETEARAKWALYRRKRITRAQLEQWLNTLDRMDRRTIKRMYASEGGR